MNAQNPNTVDPPSTITNPEQTLNYIEALSEDAAFSRHESIPHETAQVEPKGIKVGELIRMAFKYSGWILGSFVTWLAILIFSSMAVGTAFESVSYTHLTLPTNREV